MAASSNLDLILARQPIIDPKVERDIIAKRYYQPGEHSWADMSQRIAAHVCKAESRFKHGVLSGGCISPEDAWFHKFFDALNRQEIVASSPIIFNAGTPCEMLSACTGVVFAEDSIEAIFKSVSELATLTADGAGVGYNITPLRYRAAPLSRKGESSGACSFLENMDAVGKTIRQGGRNRRAAMLACLHINHPDAVEFCFIKDDIERLKHMNISLAVTDEFMRKVETDGWHSFEFPVGSGKQVLLFIEPTDMDSKPDPRFPIFLEALEKHEAQGGIERNGDQITRLTVAAVKARWLWNLIAEHAHRTGEPGLLFIDRHAEQNPVHEDAPITTTNPCGEVGLNEIACEKLGLPATDANGIPEKAHDSCNLTHIVLPRMVRRVSTHPESFGMDLDQLSDNDRAEDLKSGQWRFEVDWERLRKQIHTVIRFLDDVIELSEYRPAKIGAANRAIRKTGLGVIGFADLLIMLGIDYRSQEALDFAHKLGSFLEYHALDASCDLARERGSFLFFDNSKYAEAGIAFRNFPVEKAHPTLAKNHWEGLDQRVRLGLRNAMVTMLAPTGSTALIVGNMSNSIEPIFFKEQRRLTVDGVKIESQHWLYKEFKEGKLPPYITEELFVEAFEVTPAQHVAMQNAWQAWIGMSISKTINLPHTATVDDVLTAYRLAYEGGAKGITVYRDGSRGYQPVSNANVEMDEKGKLKLDSTGTGRLPATPNESNTPKPNLAGMEVVVTPLMPRGTAMELDPDGERSKALIHSLDYKALENAIIGVDPLLLKKREDRAPKFSSVVVPRPERVRGETSKVEFNGTKMYVTLNRAENGQPVEVFVIADKAGSDRFAECEALGRLISTGLKYGVRLSEIIKQLRGIGGETVSFYNGRRYTSLADAVGTTLAEMVGTAKPKTEADAEHFAATFGQLKWVDPVMPLDPVAPAIVAPAGTSKTVLKEALRDMDAGEVITTADVADVGPRFSECPVCKEKAYKHEAGCGICTACFYSQCK